MNRYLIIALSLLIVFVLGGFLIRPKYQDLKLTREKIVRMENDLKYIRGYLDDLAKAEANLKEVKEEASKIDSVLPADPSFPDLLNYLQNTAVQSGLILKSFSLSATPSLTKESGVNEYPFFLELSGSYPAFKNFLSNLTKSARLIEVESISFSAPKKEGEPFSFSLGIKVYSY